MKPITKQDLEYMYNTMCNWNIEPERIFIGVDVAKEWWRKKISANTIKIILGDNNAS